MKSKKAKAKLIILLGIIWIINPQVSETQFNIVISIIGVMSIPFIVLGVAWTLKPELTT